MSYARFSEHSDVYVLRTGTGSTKSGRQEYWCMACSLKPKDDTVSGSTYYETYSCDTIPEMIDHLATHRKKGHKVPISTTSRLRRERGDTLGIFTDRSWH